MVRVGLTLVLTIPKEKDNRMKWNKPISRVFRLVLDNRPQARQKDQVTVTLYGWQIGFRPYKSQTEHRVSLHSVYRLALERGEQWKNGKPKGTA